MTDKTTAQIHSLPTQSRAAKPAGPRIDVGGQIGMAERFTGVNRDRLKMAHGIGWHEWDGTRWKRDEGAAHIEAARKLVKACMVTAVKDDDDKMLKDAKALRTASALKGITEIAGAMPDMGVTAIELDAKPHLFNTPKGTIDLNDVTGDGKLTRCRQSDLITKVAGASPKDATDEMRELWTGFLTRILPDDEVRAYVQRFMGYSMYGAVEQHVMAVFTGTGANGKDTLAGGVRHAMGDYALEVDPALLISTKNERHGTFKMALKGVRLAVCSETDKDAKFAEATMKHLTGGGSIQANYMHRDPISFAPSHTLLMLTNNLPEVSGDDEAVWRRLAVVPFDVVIPEEERDATLPDRLKEAAPAILEWMRWGWIDYCDRGRKLDPPDAVRARTQQYRADNDHFTQFLEEVTEPDPANGWVNAAELFLEWSAWCIQQNLPPGSAGTATAFGKTMTARGYGKSRKTSAKTLGYTGLKMTKTQEGGQEADPWRSGSGRKWS